MFIDDSRRKFIKKGIAGLTAITGLSHLSSCKHKTTHSIKGSLLGPNSKAGHLLRDGVKSSLSTKRINTKVLIVGSGIAGLSARRWLHMNKVDEVMMIELDRTIGGNSSYGSNEVSAYPWAAHYLPVPDQRDHDLLAFLEQAKAIERFDANNIPVYNDYFVCHDPEERLYINGHWQEGILPSFGIKASDSKEIERFFAQIKEFKSAIGKDGKDAFRIPIDLCSQDELYTSLDKISFSQWLQEQGYRSIPLLWYLEYGCKDDYGCSLSNTSAWAGIHYFASRKGSAVNGDSGMTLTWPEGNGYLMKQLENQSNAPIIKDTIAYSIRFDAEKVIVSVINLAKDEEYEIAANKVILATPQFVNARLFNNNETIFRNINYSLFEYSPWVVANITINALPDVKGMPLCWDNVFYQQPSVGYVNANHQNINRSTKKVLTYYKPLIDLQIRQARIKAYQTSYEEWKKTIIEELEFAHKGISDYIEQLDVCVWGHGMIAPRPGYIWGEERQKAQQSINNKLFFAHSDLSGISIFEEAFHQGIRAAKEVLTYL